jgi:pimeloyl-ACP methyl ester carboxylesterase
MVRSDRRAVTDHTITGGGGVRLHVVEGGNPKGRPIVFIHGFSQSWLSWSRQLNSDLANDFRLIAMDLRGHGQSEKPLDDYDDSRLWGDDVDAVIGTLNLDHPVLCGWSYGPLVMLDYLRHYGEAEVAGHVFVDAITKLGSAAAMTALTPQMLGLVPDLFATDVDASLRGLESLLHHCSAHELAPEDLYLMLGYNFCVPPSVRQALFSRAFDNDDLLPTIRKPVLIVHGAQDALVTPSVVDQHRAGVAHARVCIMANAGHAPFWDDAAAFNQLLRDFCTTI